MRFSPTRKLVAVATAATLLGSVALAGPAQASPTNNSVKKLTKAVTLPGVLRHLLAFQHIADRNNDNRASGTPGYNASADYVADKLRRAGYVVTRQPFQFNFFQERGSSFAQTAPTATTYVDGTDYDLMEYSAPGDVTADVVAVVHERGPQRPEVAYQLLQHDRADYAALRVRIRAHIGRQLEREAAWIVPAFSGIRR